MKSRRTNLVLVRIEISGSHGNEYSAYDCLVCNTMKFGRYVMGTDFSL
jgi:hypothetical protein